MTGSLLSTIALVSYLLSHVLAISHATPVERLDVAPRASASFKHPGVLNSAESLDFVKAQVKAGAQPWTNAFNEMMASEYAATTRTPHPTATIQCGPTSTPNIGCTDEREDAIAAYTMALAWYITGTQAYATKAISIMNAYAQTIKTHLLSNAPLQTGWAGSMWPKAAEIIRYTDAGWATADITAFEDMLRNVYLPEVIVGSQSNGNWELVMMEAAQGIAVFLDNQTSYDAAMTKYAGRVPAYVYLTIDGTCPKAAPGSGYTTCAKIDDYWQDQTSYPENGIAQETCRDFTHTGYGIASISHVAETSRIQGTDLYTGDTGTRLRYALGFHCRYEVGADTRESWLCPKQGKLNLGLGPVTEVGFNALSFRLGNNMTNTQTYTLNRRSENETMTDGLFVAWETLTHAENPN